MHTSLHDLPGYAKKHTHRASEDLAKVNTQRFVRVRLPTADALASGFISAVEQDAVFSFFSSVVTKPTRQVVGKRVYLILVIWGRGEIGLCCERVSFLSKTSKYLN